MLTGQKSPGEDWQPLSHAKRVCESWSELHSYNIHRQNQGYQLHAGKKKQNKIHKNLGSSFPILWGAVSRNRKEATSNGEQLLHAASGSFLTGMGKAIITWWTNSWLLRPCLPLISKHDIQGADTISLLINYHTVLLEQAPSLRLGNKARDTRVNQSLNHWHPPQAGESLAGDRAGTKAVWEVTGGSLQQRLKVTEAPVPPGAGGQGWQCPARLQRAPAMAGAAPGPAWQKNGWIKALGNIAALAARISCAWALLDALMVSSLLFLCCWRTRKGPIP